MSDFDPIDIHDPELAESLCQLVIEMWGSIAAMMRAERVARKLMEMPV